MRRVLQTISWIACAATIVPSLFYLINKADLAQAKWLMLLATIVWFAVTPCWMGREQGELAADGEKGS